MSWLTDRVGNSFNLNNYFGAFGDWAGGGNSEDLGSYATLAGVYGSTPLQLQDLEFAKYADPTAYNIVDLNEDAAGLYDVTNLSDTELQDLLSNQRLQDIYGTQEDVLSRLGEYATGGMTAIDRARIAEIQNEINQTNRGNQEAILQNMAQRGLAGSGSELAARLNAQQGSAQTGYLAGSQLAGDAAQRAFEALQAQGAYASGLQGQQYGQMANAAQAQDVINRYNTDLSNKQTLDEFQTRQRVGEMNVADINRIREQNTALENQQRQYNVTQKPMNQYAMNSNQAQMAMQGLGNQANIEAQNAQSNMNFWGNLAGSAIQGGSYWAGQAEAAKKDEK